MEKDNGETLTKALARLDVLNLGADGMIVVNEEALRAMSSHNRQKIEGALIYMLQLMKNHPEMALSISPNNLHINWTDSSKTVISKVVLIDVGLSPGNIKKFEHINNLEHYVDISRDRLDKYLRVNYVDAETLTMLKQRSSPVTPARSNGHRVKMCGSVHLAG